jgi:hypothetical protein
LSRKLSALFSKTPAAPPAPPPTSECLTALEMLKGKAATAFSNSNADHEDMLLELWTLLKPDTPFVRESRENWGEVGFQGKDPATDFRGQVRFPSLSSSQPPHSNQPLHTRGQVRCLVSKMILHSRSAVGVYDLAGVEAQPCMCPKCKPRTCSPFNRYITSQH